MLRPIPRWTIGLIGFFLLGGATWIIMDARHAASAAVLGTLGALVALIALRGQFPTAMSVGNASVTWDKVDDVIDKFVENVEPRLDRDGFLSEVHTLRARLEALHQTGQVPPHPAEEYDREVENAIRRIIPETYVLRTHSSALEVPDFILSDGSGRWALETKWRADPSLAYTGRTLGPLLGIYGESMPLVVVVRANPDAIEVDLTGRVRARQVQLVAWRGPADDAALVRAIRAAREGSNEQNGGSHR